MIRLIRQQDSIEILLNASLIEHVSEKPTGGCTITLATGEKVDVKNPQLDVLQKTEAFRTAMAEAEHEEDMIAEEKEEKKVPEDPEIES